MVLGAYSELGKIIGRVGGHQKGWAESRANLSGIFESSLWTYENTPDGIKAKTKDYSQGYPFRNATDSYELNPNCEPEVKTKDGFKYCTCLAMTDVTDEDELHDSKEILLQHNLDLHVFGYPPEMKKSGPDADGFVRLKNDVRTKAQPDVKLLWIIGGNYLGQTNDAQQKRKRLEQRLHKGGTRGKILRPKSAKEDDIISALEKRIEKDGLVVVHQELFANPTTEFADIVIPAAGWGEDDFLRYNAQRRLKLYARFQDPPLHPDDRQRLKGMDPVKLAHRLSIYKHSPKSDWRIFRDIVTAIGEYFDCQFEQGNFHRRLSENKPKNYWESSIDVSRYFYWDSSAEVADDMAIWSQRGLAAADAVGLSMLGDLYLYGISVGIKPSEIRNDGVLHRLLGIDDRGEPRDDALLSPELARPSYSIPAESEVHGNRIASNGVFLPVYGTDLAGEVINIGIKTDGFLDHEKIQNRIESIERVVGSLRVDRAKLEYERTQKSRKRIPLGAPFYFVRAPWEKIEADHRRVNGIDLPNNDQRLIITNGRFNHLWNNMFHHIRNEYVNRRWPADLPGTILEINQQWAQAPERQIENGQVVELNRQSADGTDVVCKAVASLQDWVTPGHGFLMFSYPVDSEDKFEGYANNLSDGYFDGIHPIAALKYSYATVSKSATGIVYPEIFRNQRNRIHVDQTSHRSDESQHDDNPAWKYLINFNGWEFKSDWMKRLDWEMRELIVQKGLPRALLHSRQHRSSSSVAKFTEVDRLFHELSINSTTRSNFANGVLSFMQWRGPMGSKLDYWFGGELALALKWSENAIKPMTPEEKMLALIDAKRSGAINEIHQTVSFESTNLSKMFEEKQYADILRLLRAKDSSNGNPLVVPGKPDESVFYQKITVGGMKNFFNQGDHAVVKEWIESLNEEGGNGASTEEQNMLQLLQDKQAVAKKVGNHALIQANGKNLKQRFIDAENDQFEYDKILDFLRNGSVFGNKLIKPQDLEGSGFLTMIKPGGVMDGGFDEDDIAVVEAWIMSLSVNQKRHTMRRFSQVKLFLDEAVNGQNIDSHGAFWRGQTRDEFVSFKIQNSVDLLVVGDSANSEIIKRLRGDGVGRMPPAPFDAMPDVKIDFIAAWIDDNAPDELSETVTFDADSGDGMDAVSHNHYWREFDNWAFFFRPDKINEAISFSFQYSVHWANFVRGNLTENELNDHANEDNIKEAIQLLATRQMNTVESHYGNPVRLHDLLQSYELFGRGVANEGLPEDPLRPDDPLHQMNGRQMWFNWCAMADACLRQEIPFQPEFWHGHIRAILLGLFNDGVIRGRFPVDGFDANDPDVSERMRNHVVGLADDELAAEMANRFNATTLVLPFG